MLNFTLQQKVKMLYGTGAIKQLGELVLETNHKKPLIVCDKGTISAGIVKKATDSLEEKNIEYVIFDEVIPDPPVYVALRGAEVCKEHNCDMLIGIGGGSSLDTAKAINVTRFNEGPITRFADMNEKMNDSDGLVVIPTTAGTGSEVSDGIILTDTDTDKKLPILHPENIPEFAIIDPELMLTLPKGLTASTGLDVLAHAMEGYTSTLANGFTDLICEKLIATVLEWLPEAVNNGSNLEARERMASAATLGGWMLANVHVQLGHAIAHTIGTMYHIQHGYACAYALPYAMEQTAPALPEKTKKLIGIFGGELTGTESPEVLGKILGDLIYKFGESLGVTPKLPENVKYSFEEVAAEIAVEMSQTFAPRRLDKEDALRVLNRMFSSSLVTN